MVWNWLIVFPKVLVPGKTRNVSVWTVDNAESKGRIVKGLPSVLASGHMPCDPDTIHKVYSLFLPCSHRLAASSPKYWVTASLALSVHGLLPSIIFFSSSPRTKETLWVVKSKTGVSFGCKGTVLFEKLSYIGRKHPISVIFSESQSLTNGSCVPCHETSQTFGMLLNVTVLFLSHFFFCS